MHRCLLRTSLQLRAPLCHPPWTHSRLPCAGRSFAFAARLAKDQIAQANPDSKPQEKKESKKSNKAKKAEKKDGGEGGKTKDKETIDEQDGSNTKRARREKRKKKNEEDGVKKGSALRKSKSTSSARGGRRRQVRRVPSPSGVVERQIARMRKEIDAIQQGNQQTIQSGSMSLKEALVGGKKSASSKEAPAGEKKIAGTRRKKAKEPEDLEPLDIKLLNPEELNFDPVDVEIPPVPRLSYGLDRVLFNRGVYRLQDPRSRVYNFDPYLEKIMSVDEFDFSALSEYKTSSKDEQLLDLTQRMGTKFTGSTSSMSGVLQHFHFLLSNFRPLNHEMLSLQFPTPSSSFSKITEGPSACFLRWKDGIYAIDADKAYDSPNIMSWLGHSLEKLLTTERGEFERYRRSNPEAAPGEDQSARCYHYSKLGNFLMRSQLDAHDPRLPGTGIFDLKTRAVVSIRMHHEEFETGKGYQIRYDRGEWESYEREFYDMTRATMLKYSLQVRMGRMDGIFVAYHNVERIFGFQYICQEDMDQVLHGQKETCLGDQEFKMSIRLLDELMQRATEKFPEQTLRLHFHTHRSGKGKPPFMYIFAEPVTEEQADVIQNKNSEAIRAFERDIVGIRKDDPALQAEWHEIQEQVDDEVNGENVEAEVIEDRAVEEGTEKAEDVEEVEEVDEAKEFEESEATDADSSALSSEELYTESDQPLRTIAEDSEGPKGPLMGWILAVRHRVNGTYVERPEKLLPQHSWTIEYHIRELKEEDRWNLYEKVKTKRNGLIGELRDTEKSKAALNKYREVIKRYSDKGRKWREQEDALVAEAGQKVYVPLGPGSQVQAQE